MVNSLHREPTEEGFTIHNDGYPFVHQGLCKHSEAFGLRKHIVRICSSVNLMKCHDRLANLLSFYAALSVPSRSVSD